VGVVPTSVRRGEATVPSPPPQTLKIKKCKNSIVLNLLPECTKMRIFRCNFAKFSRGHAPGTLECSCLRYFPYSCFVIVTKLGLPLGNFLRTPLVVPESVYDDVVYICMESALTTAYHTSPKPLRTISRKIARREHESSIYEFLLASGCFRALHGSNLANWLADVLFRLIYRGSQHQKKLKGSWYNTCSVTFYLSDCFVTSLQYQRDLV